MRVFHSVVIREKPPSKRPRKQSRSLIEGKQTDLILFDFSKAFDKVNHLNLPYINCSCTAYKVRHSIGSSLSWLEKAKEFF